MSAGVDRLGRSRACQYRPEPHRGQPRLHLRQAPSSIRQRWSLLWSSNEQDVSYVVQLNRLIERLSDAGIDFVVVGGFAGVLHGSTLVTRDLDVCAQALGRVKVEQ